MTIRRSHYRTVRDNRVRILGKTLHCKNLKTHELDSKRFLFLLYNGGGSESPWAKEGLACLWGTEAYSKAMKKDEDQLEELEKQDKQILAPDGFLHWYFWSEEK